MIIARSEYLFSHTVALQRQDFLSCEILTLDYHSPQHVAFINRSDQQQQLQKLGQIDVTQVL